MKHQAARAVVAVALLLAVPAVSPSGDVDKQLRRGDEAVAAGSLQEAEEAYRKGLEKSPLQPLVHLDLGIVLAKQGMTEEALSELRLSEPLHSGRVRRVAGRPSRADQGTTRSHSWMLSLSKPERKISHRLAGDVIECGSHGSKAIAPGPSPDGPLGSPHHSGVPGISIFDCSITLNAVHRIEQCSEMKSTQHHRRLERQHQQREMILDAAREILVSDGYESLSMRKLADSIGYSAGTIYSYFSDKNDLVHTLVEESFASLLERIEMVPETDDAISSLRRKLHAYINFGLENPSRYHLAFVLRRTPEETPTTPHGAFELLREAVRRCRSEGHFVAVDNESASQILWVAIHGITSLLITHSSFPWVERRGLIARVVDGAIAGLEIDNNEPGANHGGDDSYR